MERPQHICIDFANVSQFILCSKESIKILLTNLVRITEMTALREPIVEQLINPDEPICCGITGVVILKESLIDIHTYPEHRAIYISIFSCKEFDSLRVLNYLQSFLGSKTNWLVGVCRMKKNELTYSYPLQFSQGL